MFEKITIPKWEYNLLWGLIYLNGTVYLLQKFDQWYFQGQ